MTTYLNSHEVSIEVQILDENGEALSFFPDAVSYRVLNSEGVELVAETPIIGYAGENFVTIVVGASLNAIPLGKTRDVRLIELKCTQGNSVAYVNHSYILGTTSELQTGINSFQTYQNAELLASEMPALDGWLTANRKQRVAAMIEAREKIGRISLRPYRIGYVDMTHATVPFMTDSIFTQGVSEFSADYFLRLPEDFINAVRKAQVAEADFILSSGTAEHKEREGLSSEKIGETSQSFKSGKKLEHPVCKRTISYLRLYMVQVKTLARG